jgi:hypothetical protein
MRKIIKKLGSREQTFDDLMSAVEYLKANLACTEEHKFSDLSLFEQIELAMLFEAYRKGRMQRYKMVADVVSNILRLIPIILSLFALWFATKK